MIEQLEAEEDNVNIKGLKGLVSGVEREVLGEATDFSFFCVSFVIE